MAAKPPKPPGCFLKSLLNQHNNNKTQQHKQQQNNGDDNKEVNCSLQNSTTATTSTIATAATTINPADSDPTTHIAAPKKNNCSCSNISIMHLFHEMKQEFPTLPDTIVAQCVNENCHQRENCIQMLKHELELNPIPAQSYPAKVLHPPNNNNNVQNTTTTTATSVQKPPLQQKPLIVQQKPPLKPIKPTRAAPLQPPTSQPQQTNGKLNCTKQNSVLNKTTNKPLSGDSVTKYEEFVGNGAGGFVDTNDRPIKLPTQLKQSIRNTTTNSATSEVCNDESDKYSVGMGEENIEKNLPRQRPTTLNLNTQLQKQQQQQRQRLNIQLQQRFQEQRNRQQPQNHNTITKPLRKAPLPPIAPKPSQLQANYTNTNNSLNDSLHTNTTSPLSESEISLSVSLSTPSPTSSSSSNATTHHQHHQHSLNKAKHSQTPTANQQQQQHHLQTKSPIRHRSVINLQPEPPYTRDFLLTPNSLTNATTAPSATSPSIAASKSTTASNSSSSSNSSPTASVAGSQKSFTSVNLTLRPPVSPNDPNSALQPSTIDITAGPGFSGASGGGKSLHYSSTSYDARLGYQQNFQITVTDECGVFTASRIRPQQQQHQQRSLNQQQQQLQLQQQQQFHNNNVVAFQQNIQNSIQSPQSGNITTGFGSGSGGGTSPYKSGNMCLPPQQAMDAPTKEILQRQKKKRDKLAAALREYKKRLGNVEQEINLLTGTIPTEGLSERLDEEITKLRRDCQDMLRSSNTFTQPPLQQELAINHQPQQSLYQQRHQQPPQPFPRQRITQPPQRLAAPHQTSLDIIQHHSQTSTPHTPPAASLPNLNLYSPLQLQQLQQSNQSMPSYFHQQSAPFSNNFVNNNEVLYTDHNSYDQQDHLVEDDADDYDEYEEVIEQPWECNMCTFRNHPQLNICETCENVRIIPGRLTNLSRALSASNCTNNTADATDSNVLPSLGLLRGSSSNNAINNSNSRNGLNAANGNLEHDTNLVQQQLQHFALHT